MPDFRRKNVLVTGANGFIGAHLVAALMQRGANVTCVLRTSGDDWRFRALDLAPTLILRCDLYDSNKLSMLLEPLDIDYVYHLAAERDTMRLAKTDWPRHASSLGASVMRAIGGKPVIRFVSLGSSLEILGCKTGRPDTPHGRAKAHDLNSMRTASKQYDLPFSPTRTHYVYGPLQSDKKLIPQAIRAARQGHALPLTGSDVFKRFIFVADVVEALLKVPDTPATPDKVQLITHPQQYSNQHIVDQIAQLTGKPISTAPGQFQARAFDRRDWDLAAAGTPLANWQPRTQLRDGLRACIEWEPAELV